MKRIPCGKVVSDEQFQILRVLNRSIDKLADAEKANKELTAQLKDLQEQLSKAETREKQLESEIKQVSVTPLNRVQ